MLETTTNTLEAVVTPEPNNFLVVLIILILVQLVKVIEAKYIRYLTPQTQDKVYPLLSAILVLLAGYTGQISASNVWNYLPLLFAPNGLYNFLMKVFMPHKNE